MPEALSTGPPPYRHDFPRRRGITTGWAWPPKDYGRWGDLIEAWARHLCRPLRHGAGPRPGRGKCGTSPTASTGAARSRNSAGCTTSPTPRSDGSIPEARVGGPHVCGPTSPEAATFLRAFLDHCARGRNHATGRTGTKLDFIAFHAKGRPRVVDGHVRMGLAAPARRDRSRSRHRPRVPRARRRAGHPRRIRPGGLRRLLGRDPSGERLSRRSALRRERRRGDRAHDGTCRARRHRPSRAR